MDSRRLNLVRMPARYTGGELNAARKPWKRARLRICLAFPDLYEIGMSNLGLRILYQAFNDHPECLADRVFAPAEDMERLLAESGEPLAALESGRPPAAFDLLGVTLASELSYTNLLTILSLGGVPTAAADRGEEHPLVIGGGNGAFAPEPMADFCDAFFIGEGDHFAREAAAALLALPGTAGRAERLRALGRLPGIYMPGSYEPSFDGSGRFRALAAAGPDSPPLPVRRVTVSDFENAPFPTDWLTPFLPVVHDRVGLEIMRGCVHRCLYCQARVIYGPCRTRSPETVFRLARETFAKTGYEEMALLSLSTGDYPRLEELHRLMTPFCREKNIRVSFPSLRADTLDLDAAGGEDEKKKMALTLAPESSERLRRAVGKEISDEQFLARAEAARRAGWRRLKLYFMIGLPGETEADLAEIVAIADRLSRHLRLNLAVNTFIPKPHTPLERRGMISEAEHETRTAFIRKNLAGNRFVSVHFHPWRQSFLEGLLCRGDRRLGAVIRGAWENGARFDSWLDSFRPGAWAAALDRPGLDAGMFLDPVPGEAALPWDHVKV